MKKILFLALSSLVAFSCQEEVDMAGVEMPAQGEAFTLTATVPANSGTKVAPHITSEGIDFKWFGGTQWNYPDMLTVYDVTTGDRVGNFIINELNQETTTATFSAVGDTCIDPKSKNGEKKYEVVYDDATFTLDAAHSYVAVFPKSGAATLTERNAEALNPYQYSDQLGAWRDNARMISAEFSASEPNLTFTHETAFMSIEFNTSASTATPTGFKCDAGNGIVTTLGMGGYSASPTYTAHFPIYPTTTDKLTFTITDSAGQTKTIVRDVNAGVSIEAGKYYKQTIVEETGGETGGGTEEIVGEEMILKGDFDSCNGDVNQSPANTYSGGFASAFVAGAGKDGTTAMQYTVNNPIPNNTKINFNKFVGSSTGPVNWEFTYDDVVPAEGADYIFTMDIMADVDYTLGTVNFGKLGYQNQAQAKPSNNVLTAGEWTTISCEVHLSDVKFSGINIVITDYPGSVITFDNVSFIRCEAVQ